MTRKTHILAAASLSLFILNPSSAKYCIVDLVGTSIGSMIPDIDVSTSDSHKDILTISILSILFIGASIGIDLIYNFGLIKLIRRHTELSHIIISFLLFILLCAHGLHTKHRTFMHSFLATFIFTFLVYCIFPNIALPFFIGMVSHILLDLLNHKKVQIFYPSKKKYYLNLCSSNGIVNNVIAIASIISFIFINKF